ncbi:MAG: hypothetical protein WB420_23450 [Bradyrhizobium sp.]|jgi:hypothetical protein
MRKIILTTTLLVLAAGPMAIAQTGDRLGTTNRSSPSSDKQMPWPAPTGHRQPRIEQVPSENDLNNPNDAVAREDAALDRKLKSICRGC